MPLSEGAVRVLRALVLSGRAMSGAQVIQHARVGWGHLEDVLPVLERRGYVRVDVEYVGATKRGRDALVSIGGR